MGIATYTASESDFSCDVPTVVHSPATTALQGAAAAETSLIAVHKELEVRFLAGFDMLASWNSRKVALT